MNILSNSGGSLQFIELVTSNRELIKTYGYEPDIIAGGSSGAIAAVVSAFSYIDDSLWDWALERGVNVPKDVLFPVPPYNNNGGITFKGAVRGLKSFSKHSDIVSLGIQDVGSLIAERITEDLYREYLSKDLPDIQIGMVNPDTYEYKMVSLRGDGPTYEDFLNAVAASSAIPVTTQPVKYQGQYYVDSGMLYHNLGPVLLEKYKDNIKHYVSVYSRGDNIVQDPDKSWQRNIWRTMMNSTNCLIMQVSYLGQKLEESLCDLHDIKYKHIFLPDTTSHLYDTNPDVLKRLKISAIEETSYYWGKGWK